MFKKKGLLVALSVLSVGGVSLVAINAGNIASDPLSADTICDEHSGNHYTQRDPSKDTDGCKEYWVCCNCHQHFISQPLDGTWSEAGVATEVVESTDDRFIDKTITVSITNPTHYIYNGESIVINSKVTGWGKGEVTWEIPSTTETTNYWEITDNKDGTATLKSKLDENSTLNKSCAVTVKSKDDTTKSQKVTFYSGGYTSTVIDFVGGMDNKPPYFGVYGTFSTSGDKIYAYKTTTGIFDEGKAIFKAKGYTERVDGNDYYYTKDMVGTDKGYTIEYHIYQSGTKTYLEIIRHYKSFTTFPTQVVNDFISGKTTSTFVVPDDGNQFKYALADSLWINSNGSAETYIGQLQQANYYIIQDKYTTGLYHCVSPERTLVIDIKDNTTSYDLTISTQAAPTKTDWTADDKTLMNSYLGELVPFVQSDYGEWYDNIEYNDCISSTSYRPESYAVADQTLSGDTSYVRTDVSGTPTFTKDKPGDNYSSIVLQILKNSTITASVVQKEFTDWKSTEVMAALGTDVVDTLPAPTGEAYKYSFATNAATYSVKGKCADYMTVLETAGYVLDSKSTTYDKYYEAPQGTISLHISVSSTWYTVYATGHLPAGHYHEFPAELVKKELALTTETIPAPTGTRFVYTDNGDYDCIVLVKGGDKATYAGALVTAGYTENVTDCYSSGNICIDLATHAEGFTANYYLAEKPSKPAWPSDVIASALSGRGCTTTSIPEPTTYTNVTVSAEQSIEIYSYYTFKYKEIVVEGATSSDYITQLEGAGFKTYPNYPKSGWTDIYNDDDDTIICVDVNVTTYLSIILFTATWLYE